MNKVIFDTSRFSLTWQPTLEQFGLIDRPLYVVKISLPKSIQDLRSIVEKADARIDGAYTMETRDPMRSFYGTGAKLFKRARRNKFKPLSDSAIESILPDWGREVFRAHGQVYTEIGKILTDCGNLAILTVVQAALSDQAAGV